ncbi:MAG: DegT/DnrJ/EryC1/StrS family aminotransferase [Spirochaetaceae bacterium]|jgi:dTDP-4-amino-4,6-dideoxygalactose transaminase|nr:DegT/DnrJ/EryC1/StrS family aminotransferase [Spirochaetaceae bacterium]
MMIDLYSPGIKRKEMDGVLTVMVDEKIGPGEQAARLLAALKERLGFEFALSLRSPAFALYAALRALDVPAGQRVAVSALCPLYYLAVLDALALSPLFCDVEAGGVCVGAQSLREALERSGGDAPRAAIITGTLGFLPDWPALREVGLPLIEDASRAFGSTLGGAPAGTFGVLSMLGLEERDMVTAGGGAILFAMEKRNAATLRSRPLPSDECALADMNAAMAVAQLRESAKNARRRKEIAELYTRQVLQTRHKLIAIPDSFEYNNYAFPLVLETGMKDVLTYAGRKDIEAAPAFDQTPAAKSLCGADETPNAHALALRTALFPIYSRLGAACVERVAKVLRSLP